MCSNSYVTHKLPTECPMKFEHDFVVLTAWLDVSRHDAFFSLFASNATVFTSHVVEVCIRSDGVDH